MKKGWQTKTLGEVCAVDKCQGVYKNLPYVGLENIESQTGRFVGSTEPIGVKSSTFKFSPKHVLYGRLRPYLNKVMLPDFIGHCSTEIFPLKPGPGLSREFLQYWFLRDATVGQIDATSTGARMPRANMTAVLGFEFPLLPFPEQQRIVGILDEAFDGIATAKANAEKNLQNARTLFESHLQSVFSRSGKGWATRQLGEVCDFEGGSQPPKSQFIHAAKTGYVRFLQIRDFANEKHITFIAESKKNRLCRKEDIMIGRYGASVGKILTGKAGAYNVALMKTIPNPALLSRDFFYHYLISGAFQERLMNVAARSAQNGFSKEDIYGFLVPVPPLKEQQKVIDQLGPLSEETQRLASLYERKLAALEALKKSLLHQAFTGQLTMENG